MKKINKTWILYIVIFVIVAVVTFYLAPKSEMKIDETPMPSPKSQLNF